MSTTDNAPLTIRDMIEPAIKAAGGWVNTHAHADRAYTLSPDVLEMRRTCTLQQKWDALDRLKRESTEEDFYRRFSLFFENQISQGVTALATFVDIDPQSEDRAIMAGALSGPADRQVCQSDPQGRHPSGSPQMVRHRRRSRGHHRRAA